ncbi:MAG: hypothetical protein PHW69_01450 [Elusimicrobiaceae bacterium]|nr:hypothetical protein [Elusimicrobiaceae bacterium]
MPQNDEVKAEETEIKPEETAKEETAAVEENGADRKEDSCRESVCCCGKGRIGSERELEHIPLRNIAIGFKFASALPVVYFLVSVFLRVKDYSQVPAEYMGQFWKIVALSSLVNFIACAIIAMIFYAMSECIKITVEAAQNVRDIRDSVNEKCCK